jgi:hypothetical protein
MTGRAGSETHEVRVLAVVGSGDIHSPLTHGTPRSRDNQARQIAATGADPIQETIMPKPGAFTVDVP